MAAVAVAFRRRAHALAESFRRAGRLPADGSVVVVPGPAIQAYALVLLAGASAMEAARDLHALLELAQSAR